MNGITNYGTGLGAPVVQSAAPALGMVRGFGARTEIETERERGRGRERREERERGE